MMHDRFTYRAKTAAGDWMFGPFFPAAPARLRRNATRPAMYDSQTDDIYEVDPDTVGQCTELPDKDGNMLFEGDITSLVVDGEERRFVVAIKTVERRVVSHSDFDAPTAKVAITGVVFEWNGYQLFPCVDESGVPDNQRMSRIGNIHDNPGLITQGDATTEG